MSNTLGNIVQVGGTITGNGSGLTNVPAANLTGTVSLTNGGTGQTSATAAFTALAPTQTGESGKFLTTNGTIASWGTTSVGTVTSVAVSVPSVFSVAGSPITTSGTITLSYSGTALPLANGGTGQTTATAALNALLPVQTGLASTVLTTDGTNASWVAASGGLTIGLASALKAAVN